MLKNKTKMTAAFLIRLGVAAALGVAASAARADLLSNGSFEDNSCGPAEFCTVISGGAPLPDWTLAGSVNVVANSYWQAGQGLWSIDLNGDAPGTISQSFMPLATGPNLYSLTLMLSGNPQGQPFDKELRVELGNATFLQGNPSQIVLTFNTSSFPNRLQPITDMMWAMKGSYLFTADSVDDVTVTFASFTPGASGPVLDNIVVTQVPEPVSLITLLAGLGMLGFMARRKTPRA